MRLKLAILASGSGSNAEAIIKAAQSGKLDADIKLVFVNKENAYVIERAKKLNVPCVVLSHKEFASREEYDSKMLEILKKHDVDTVAMAGFMRIVSPKIIDAFRNRIINVHPAILPSFAGAHGIEDAKNWGVKIFGCTVHFVDEIMDNGEIIIQAAFPADFENYDKSIELLHNFEHKLFIQALRWLSEERIEIHGRATKILPKEDAVYEFVTNNALVFPFLEV